MNDRNLHESLVVSRFRTAALAVCAIVSLSFCAQSGRYTGTTSEGLPFWVNVTAANAIDSFHVTYRVFTTRGQYLYQAASTTWLYTPISIVNNSFNYSRTTSDTLLLTGTFSGSSVSGTFYKSEYNTSAYRREVSGRLTYNATHGSSLVAPAITSHPSNRTVTEGQTATFSVTASGTAPLSYQWQRGTANITGATAASYTTPVTTTADNGATFRCVVTNAAGSVTSNAATLTVNPAVVSPQITAHPQDQSVIEGDLFTMSVTASGTELSYQWATSTDNGATWNDISGATSATYSRPALATDNNRRLRCRVSNSAGSAVSNAAMLQITALEEYLLASGMASPLILKISPRSGAICAQFPAPEPVSGMAYSGSVLYTSSTVSPRIFVLDPVTGKTTRAPYVLPDRLTGVAFGDGYLWGVNLAGLIYKINPVSGAILQTVPGSAPYDALDFQNGYLFASAGNTVFKIDPVTFSVAGTMQIPRYQISGIANGTGNFWGVWGTPQIGRFDQVSGSLNAMLNVSGAAIPLFELEFVGATRPPSSSPVLQSPVSNASNIPLSVSFEWQSVTGAGYYVLELATNSAFTSSLTTRTRLSGTSCTIDGLNQATTYFWRVLACNEGGSGEWSAARQFTTIIPVPMIVSQPANVTVVEGATATFTVTASGTAPLSYQWQRGTTNIAGATSASYTTPATSLADNGATFRCVVSNAGGNVTSNAATLTVTPRPVAPSITTQPSSATVVEGATATFTVAASGTAPLAYQWQRGTTNITGATSASYTTPVTTTADNSATFRCVVTNAAGSATSNAATLTVNAAVVAPSITTQPSNVAVTEGEMATFTVAASGTAPLSYQWQRGTTNIAGATSASYTTPVATTADNGATFRCVVTNAAGSANSNAATLTVTRKTFTLEVVSDGNGTVSVSEPVSVPRGDTVRVTATPESYFRFDAWIVEQGEALILEPQNPHTGIVLESSNVRVKAVFAREQCVLTVIADGPGSVEPAATTTVDAGGRITVTAIADTGSLFVKWVVTGGDATIADSLAASTDLLIESGEVSVKAVFEKKRYAVALRRIVTADSSVSLVDTVVSHGDTLRYAAPAIAGLHFAGWQILAGSVSIADTLADTLVAVIVHDSITIAAKYDAPVTARNGSSAVPQHFDMRFHSRARTFSLMVPRLDGCNEADIRIRLLDPSGRQVAIVAEGLYAPGYHTINLADKKQVLANAMFISAVESRRGNWRKVTPVHLTK